RPGPRGRRGRSPPPRDPADPARPPGDRRSAPPSLVLVLEGEGPEPLRVLDAAPGPELPRPLPNPGGGGLAALRLVPGQGLQLHLDRLGDVNVRIGLLRAQPKVRDLERLQALVQELGELRPGGGVGHDRAQGELAGRPVIGVVDVPAVARPQARRIRGDHHVRPDPADLAGHRAARLQVDLELAIAKPQEGDAANPQHLGRGPLLAFAHPSDLLPSRAGLVGPGRPVGDHHVVDVGPLARPQGHRASAHELGVVGVRKQNHRGRESHDWKRTGQSREPAAPGRTSASSGSGASPHRPSENRKSRVASPKDTSTQIPTWRSCAPVAAIDFPSTATVRIASRSGVSGRYRTSVSTTFGRLSTGKKTPEKNIIGRATAWPSPWAASGFDARPATANPRFRNTRFPSTTSTNSHSTLP